MVEKQRLDGLYMGLMKSLGDIYWFTGDSNPAICVFNPEEPGNNVIDALGSAGVDRVETRRIIESYKHGGRNEASICMRGAFKGSEYLIMVPEGLTEKWTAYALSEGIMNGEHMSLHCAGQTARGMGFEYLKKFPPVTMEFMGCMGRQEALTMLQIDEQQPLFMPFGKVSQEVGYQLARKAAAGEPGWKRAMFHAPDRGRMFGIYNEVFIPDIIIRPGSRNNKETYWKRVADHLFSLGLKCRLHLVEEPEPDFEQE